MNLRHAFTVVALLTCLSVQAATEVITLNYRMASDVLAVAESVVGTHGKVSPYGNQLIVNAPETLITELRQVLAQLDSEPRSLLISVDTQGQTSQSGRGYSVDGAAGIGGARIETGRGEIRGRDQVRIIHSDSNRQSAGVQQVRTNEGYPALIQIGQSVPLTSSGVDRYGQLHRQTQYRNVTQGFYATATVNGDRVQVTLSSHNDQLSHARPGSIDVQSTQTRVSGRLGEWISIGGIDESTTSDQSGMLRRHSFQSGENHAIKLKVDLLD